MDRLVTKTLAEIYLQQGHLEEAYSLFKTLSERAPEDAEIKNRLKELEEKLNLSTHPSEVSQGHPADLPPSLQSSIQPTRSAPKKIQNLEKWLINIRERRKP